MDDLYICQTPLCHCNTEERLNFKLLQENCWTSPVSYPAPLYMKQKVA